MNLIPSSSPGFGTPPIRLKPSILPILLSPAALRPLAVRTFTKKHGLTLTTAALELLSAFIGRSCGSEWRAGGLAEPILESVASTWRQKYGGMVIVEGGAALKEILKDLEGRMSGGRISNATPGKEEIETRSELGSDLRKFLTVVDAFDQPRLVYNVNTKHFDKESTKPSLLPSPSSKTQVFRNRYNLIHQRLLRNESFQAPSIEATQLPSLRRTSSTLTTPQHSYKLTPIANLLGRNGSNHLLLGLLTIAPSGTLAINDLTGSIALDLTHAKTIPEDGAWFVPGMIVLVDGVYEEEDSTSGVSSGGGIGGTIGGKFVGFTVGGPPCERRQVTLGVSGSNDKGDTTAGGGFGWVDFLGLGSERAVGFKLRELEQRLVGTSAATDEHNGRTRIVVIGEINLDQPRTLQALAKVFGLYAVDAEDDTPIAFILTGNFSQYPVLARGASGGSDGSIDYKEFFDTLASVLSDFPSLLQSATFIFVPGDNDGWTGSPGASAPLPHTRIPKIFTSRIDRLFPTASRPIWTTNPCRISFLSQELVILRDDISGRLRRSAINFVATHQDDTISTDVEDREMADVESETERQTLDSQQSLSAGLLAARKLVKTVLDQGYISPFPMTKRPVHWDYVGALQLYPLPTAVILVDTEAPAFCLTYEGCHVMNPGSLVTSIRRRDMTWVEYNLRERIGTVRQARF